MKKLNEILLSLKDHVVLFWKRNIDNRDLLTFMVFLLISTGLWFINALRKDYITTVKYPIKYSNLPEGYIFKDKTSDWVDARIKGSGYSLVPYYFGKDHIPLFLSVSNFRLRDNDKEQVAYVLSSEFFKSVSSRLEKDVELLEIFPDTLIVKLDVRTSKMVPVNYVPRLSFKSGYDQSAKMTIEPEMVEISGPESLIDSITEVKAIYNEELVDLSDSVKASMQLQLPAKIKAIPSDVSVTIPIEAFTEKKLSIPITGVNIPDSILIKTFPANLNLSCRVPVSKFANVNSSMFDVVVDFKTGVGSGLPEKLKVKIDRMPDDVKNVSYSPLFVECLFERKNEND